MATDTDSSLASRNRSPLALAAFAFALFLSNTISRFPGMANHDSEVQYAQAVSGHFNDWHPPIMAWLWSILLLMKDGTGLLFSFHVLCYWVGFGSIAFTLGNMGRPFAAWAIIGISILPPILMQNIQIHKDVGMAVTLLAAFAICFWYRSQGKALQPAGIVVATALIIYGGLVRSNAVFAVPPLIVYMARPALLMRPMKCSIICLAIAALSVGGSDIINHKILRAEPTFPLSSLETFDIAGIAHYSGDLSVFEDERVTKEMLAVCYNPVLWDTLGEAGKCTPIRKALGQRPTEKWISAVSHHPLAYARHRITHFDYELSTFLLVHHPDDKKYDWKYFVHAEPITQKDRFFDAMRFCSAFSPWFVLVLGIVLLPLTYPGSGPVGRISCLKSAAFCLTASGIIYMMAYLVVGVASEYRYYYWPLIAIFVATVLFVSEQREVIIPFSMANKVSVSILLLFLVSIQIAQTMDRNALFLSGRHVDERTRRQIEEP